MSSIVSLPDPVTWGSNEDYIWMKVRNMNIGFQLANGVFALLPGGLRSVISEPVIYVMVRPQFDFGSGWEYFNAQWATDVNDYVGLKGGDWDSEQAFGWEHEFNVRDPPAGNDVLVKNYVQLNKDHRTYRYITKITPYVNIDNIGMEYVHIVNPNYISHVTKVYVERPGGVIEYHDLQQVKDIKVDISDALLKTGLVYTVGGRERTLAIFDQTQWNWEHGVIKTEQMNIGGDDHWVIRIGGADTTTPNALLANQEMVF